MREIKAPGGFRGMDRPWLFLSGSIEMGSAEDWQSRVVSALKDLRGTVLNPRRDDWDDTWRQDREDARFVEQVRWELQALDDANAILVYFSPGTKAPITLLELGLHARWGYPIVCCPDGFYRQGNVDLTCERYKIPFFRDLEEALEHTRRFLT